MTSLDLKSHAPAGSMRELLGVSFPLVISAGSLSMMTVVDRVMLAHLSLDALAAALPAGMLLISAISLFLGIAGYTNAFVSQYEGAGHKDRVTASIWQGTYIAITGGLLILPMIFVAKPLFAMLNHSPEVQKLEVIYFAWQCPAALPMLLSTVFSAYFMARKKTAVIMWVNVFTAIFNIVAGYLLIFGPGPFPRLEVAGAAIATTLAQLLGALILFYLLVRETQRDGYPLWETMKFDRELAMRNIRYGFPNGIQMFLDVGAFTVFVAIVGNLGTQIQAATNLAFTLNSLAFTPLMGMGTAIVTLVGHRVGEGRPELAIKTVWKAFGLSGTLMILFAVFYLSFPDLILRFFVNDADPVSLEQIRPLVIQLLKYVALYTFFDAMAIVFGAAIRGAGDTTFSLVFSVACGWLLMVVPTILSVKYGWGIHGCWIAVTVTVFVMGFGFLYRFQRGRWKTMKVIENRPRQVPVN